MITQHEVMRFFSYDPETGDFKRTHFINNRGEIYKRLSDVKSRHQHGYYMAVIFGKRYRVHHLIFLYMTGVLPEQPVDHINGNRTDNRWCNLRLVEKVDNQRNQGVRVDSKSGRTGVYWYPPLKKYQAQITIHGNKIHLGYYSKIEDAVEARVSAQERFGFHPNHGGRPSWQG